MIATPRNPLSPEPWWELAVARASGGDLQAAQRALERAVRVQPANPETWRRLGRLRLSALSEPRPALRDFQAALFLDPQDPQSQSDVIEASRAVGVPAP
jgi:cytochrome c-type biogenesis protein CcmH/NrfG